MKDFLSLGSEYRKYFLATVLTSVGSGMQFIAMSWVLYKMTGSSASIGWILIISTVPGMLFSPWIGAIVDRYEPRIICISTDVIRGVILILLVLTMYHGMLEEKWIYLSAFLLAICENFFQPAASALVRDTVTTPQLLTANIAGNIGMQVGTLVGAGIGGVLVAATGPTTVVLLDSVSFFISAVLTFWILTQPTIGTAQENTIQSDFMQEFRETLTYMRNNSFLIWITVVQVLVYITLYVCNTLLPVFVDRELRASAAGFGLIDSAWGIGAVGGGFVLAYLSRKLDYKQFTIFGLLALASAILILLTSLQVLQAAFAYLLIGFLTCVLRLLTDTILVTQVDRRYFGKVKASIAMVISYLSLGVYAIVGYLGDEVSIRWIYLALLSMILLGFFACLYFASYPSTAINNQRQETD
ncbi:MFS transporter [Rosenbergiella epipactidis]|uniref:MFS transporter n=1 Tax=Rosenbergiella epipactidis TaxID=1544694 RepID=UPI001F4EB431|nr:MFS transporter [Rosenbergiella epipactidis]